MLHLQGVVSVPCKPDLSANLALGERAASLLPAVAEEVVMRVELWVLVVIACAWWMLFVCEDHLTAA